MDRKRDEFGRIAKRVPGQYSNKIINFRVTENEYRLFKRAQKMGIDARAILLDEIRKRVHRENSER